MPEQDSSAGAASAAQRQLLDAEAALRHSEERLRMAVEAGQVGIWDWDIVANKVTWSDRVYRMHDMEPGTDNGGYEGFRSRIHPDDLPMIEASMAAALAGGPPYSAEFRTRLPDGGFRWITTQGHLVRDAEGRPLRMVGASTDVTQRVELLAAERRARDAAEAARRRFELLAKAGSELAESFDPDETLRAIATTIVPAVADWCRIDLLDENGVMQRRLAYHTDPRLAAEAHEMTLRLRAAASTTGSMAAVVARGVSHHGHFDSPEVLDDPALHLFTRTFGMGAYYIVPLLARGRIIGSMAVIQAESGRGLGEEDRALILELGQRAALALDNARLFAEAAAARTQAETANRAKDEFLAMLGHELRNPLAPIATALELMARRSPDGAREERSIIGRQVTHLSRLIDDLLDVSRITQGKIELRREPIDMRSVVANALELTRPVFEKRKPVQLRLAPGSMTVSGDSVRLTQVLCNLLVNAGKFTPHDGDVSLVMESRDGQVQVSVQDTGSGIASDLLPRVFDLFVQGRQDMDRQSGGLGLGLTLVRTLVEMHGGTVVAASEGAGRGSRFDVRLPLIAQAASPLHASVPAADARAAGGGRIIVVDDNADAAETLSELLRMVGYDVRHANHGEQALGLLDQFIPEVALLDIGLPGIDGYQLAGMLRADPRTAGMTLVALTGYGRENDRARALAARFDEHLTKPVMLEQLLEVLNKYLPAASA